MDGLSRTHPFLGLCSPASCSIGEKFMWRFGYSQLHKMFHHGLRANILLVVLVCREYGERQQGKTENNEKKFKVRIAFSSDISHVDFL